jgi:hypothetical protein
MSGPALPELQALFWRALEGACEPALTGVVVDAGRLSAVDRLGIYAGMYFWRLRDVLAEDFEKTAEVLGPDPFSETVRAYLRRHPSGHPSVRHVGRHFADFLASHPPAGSPPWLADLARLEWARVEVFDAADAAVMSREHLRELPPPAWADLVLRPIPALAVVTSAWPLPAIWRGDREVASAPTAVRVWRQDGVVYHCAMDAPEEEALAVVGAEGAFGQVCEVFDGRPPAAAASEAGALLMRWIEDGLLRRPGS